LHSYYGVVRLLVPLHHRLRLLAFPTRTAVLSNSTPHRRSDTRPPRFRYDPFARDVAFDPGRASAPRMTVPHMLPSSEYRPSAPAMSNLSCLNPTPHAI